VKFQEGAAQVAGFRTRPDELGRVDGRVLFVELDQLDFSVDVRPAKVQFLVFPEQSGFRELCALLQMVFRVLYWAGRQFGRKRGQTGVRMLRQCECFADRRSNSENLDSLEGFRILGRKGHQRVGRGLVSAELLDGLHQGLLNIHGGHKCAEALIVH
jgi:hypothetical protein